MAITSIKRNIPEGWRRVKLGDCLMHKPDYGINAAAVKFSDNLPAYLRITDISEDGKFRPEKKSSVAHAKANDYLLQVGDLVVARTGASVGKSYFYNPNDGELVFAGFLIRIRSNTSRLAPSFLSAYLHTSKYSQWVKETSPRSGQPGINSTEYASLPLTLPPVPEQKRIVAVLEIWDKSIQKLAEKIKRKKNIKKGLMDQFVYHAKDATEYFISDLFELGRGRVIARGEIENNPGEYPVYSSQTSNDGIFGNIASFDFEGEYLTWTTDGANAGRVFYRNGKFNCTNVCGTAKLKEGLRVNLYFAYSYLNYITKNYVSYVGNPKLMNGVFGKIKINLPDIEDQNRIANILTAADKEIQILEQKLKNLRNQKNYLLNNLIIGTIRTPEKLSTHN